MALLALVAGGDPAVAAGLAVAMGGFQASIGAVNDLVDAGHDRIHKPAKPIPAGDLSARGALVIAVVGGLVGLVLSAVFGPLILALGGAGFGTGLAYDLSMRQRGLGWLCFAAAFPLLLCWTWAAVTGTLPPGWIVVLPLAGIAGPTIHLANGLVDLEADRAAGVGGLAVTLGRSRGIRSLAVLTGLVHGLAWVTILAIGPEPLVLSCSATATAMAATGVALSAREARRSRDAGWALQAVGVALLGLAWVVAAVAQAG